MKNDNPLPQLAPDEILPGTREDIPERTDWLGIGQFVFSSIAAIALLGFSLISLLATLIQHSFSPVSFPLGSDLSPYLFAAGLGGMGLLMIPSAFWAGRRLFGKGPSRQMRQDLFPWLGFLALILLPLGFGIQTGPEWSKGFLPIIHVLVNTGAVFWLLGIARRKLPGQSASRYWGSIASGLGLTPLITFILEVMILVGIGLVWVLLLGAMPEFRQDLLNLANLLQDSAGNPQDLQLALGELAARPGVLFTLFGYVAFLIPIVEELFKPLAVILLSRKKLQPWEGFVIGATSGAGYALFENLTIGAAADVWTFVTLTRTGTAAVHIFTTGLVGWGLTSALRNKKFGQAAAAIFTAVLVHGAWNGLNILSAVGDFSAGADRLGSMWSVLAEYAPVSLALLALGSFGGMIRANKSFRRAIMAGSN